VTHDDAHPRIDIFAQAKIFHNFQFSLTDERIFEARVGVKIKPPPSGALTVYHTGKKEGGKERGSERETCERAKEIKVKFPFLGCVYEWLYIPYLWKILEVHTVILFLCVSSNFFFSSFMSFTC
jgi:hypothetical protein